MAFINPCVRLAAVGCVPDDGVVPLICGEEAGWADEVADSVGVDMVGPFLGKGSVEADREAVVAPERFADGLVGEKRGVLGDLKFVEGVEAGANEGAGVGEVVDAALVSVAGL